MEGQNTIVTLKRVDFFSDESQCVGLRDADSSLECY